MASPTPSDLHINRPLTNVTIAFMQNANEFIADRVFPNIGVDHKSDSYYIYERAEWNRSQAQKRARSTESAGGGWNVETATYNCERFAFHKDIDDMDRANQDAQFNIDREAAQFTAHQLLLTRESQFVSSFFGTGIWDTDLTGKASSPSTNEFLQWDQSGSTPISDIKDAALAQTKVTGYRPNTLVLGPEVLRVLEEHADIVDRIKYTERAIVTVDLLASLFGIERVFVPYPIQNTANEGADESNSFFYGKSVLLAYAAPNPGLMTPSAGYTFNWRRYAGAGSLTPVTSRFRMDELKSDRVESELAFDMKAVATEMGTYFSAAVA